MAQKSTPELTSFLVNTPELEKEYEKIVVEVFSELGRDRDEIMAEEKGVDIWKFVVQYQGKFVGAGRVVKMGDAYIMQRGAVLKEYRLLGLNQEFNRIGVEFLKKMKKPHERIETYVHVFSRKSVENAGFVVDFSKPMRLDATPLIYYRATVPDNQQLNSSCQILFEKTQKILKISMEIKSRLAIVEVNSPEMQKEYERIILESFADQGRDQDDLLSEKEGKIWRYLVKFDEKYIGTGRVAKIKDTFYFQRGAVLKEYRSNGIFATSLKMGVDWIYTFKQPEEKIAIFVNVFSKTPAEKVGFVVDYERPSRVGTSPLIYYKAYHQLGQDSIVSQPEFNGFVNEKLNPLTK